LLTIIIAAVATGLAVPSPARVFGNEDYPTWAMTNAASAASVIHLVVDPNGKVAQCTSVREFGDHRLAKEVCLILSRKRFHSPALRDGQKVYAFLDTMIRLFLPDTDEGRTIMALRTTPDAELSVNKLPSGNTAQVGVDLAYDAAGKITDCAPSEHEKEVGLANIACGQRAMFDNAPQKDTMGQPVAYVTQKRFRFTVTPLAK
jgi:hypothetical protein